MARLARPTRHRLLALLIAVALLYAVVPQLGGFRDSLGLLPTIDRGYLVVAALLTSGSYLAAAMTYYLLALRPLRYLRTLLVQLAGMFVNRLLPAGIGGMGINYAYLRRSGHSGASAASVVAANNSLGVIGHSLLLAFLLVMFYDQLPNLQLWRVNNLKLIGIVTLAVLVAWLVFYRRYGQRWRADLRRFGRQLATLVRRPRRLTGALFSSISLTLCNVASFYFCVLAVHVSLPFLAVLIVFSFGVALGTATPTPGGLGGVEAGLVSGLMVYHVDSAAALAAVLIYRLVSYWIPLLVGSGAFIVSQKRHYI